MQDINYPLSVDRHEARSSRDVRDSGRCPKNAPKLGFVRGLKEIQCHECLYSSTLVVANLGLWEWRFIYSYKGGRQIEDRCYCE